MEREREREIVCVCVEREREYVCVCVCGERDRDRRLMTLLSSCDLALDTGGDGSCCSDRSISPTFPHI